MIKKMIACVLAAAAVCAVEPKFDWSAVVTVPPGTDFTAGHQILHFKSKDRPYTESEEAAMFFEKYLKEAVVCRSDAEVLRYGSDHVKLKGLYLELGVCTGKTVNFIAALNPQQKIYGFDSFEGLPEDWVRKDQNIPAGTFGFKDSKMLPPVLHNVDLIKGWFETTLPEFDRLMDPEIPIAFLHIDSDIYSSAAMAFKVLGHRIRPGTIIVFDELYNYPGYDAHEFKAFQEFLASAGLGARYLAFNFNHEQVAVEIVDKK